MGRNMDKSKEGKNFINRNALIGGVFVFAIAPMLINIGLAITDVIYANTGFALTAKGLNNVEWLDFWKQYLAITISFLGVCLVYISASKDRQMQLRDKAAQQYLDEVRQEERILVEIASAFNIGVIYNALLQSMKTNPIEGKKALAESRTKMDQAHIKFELLTELCDDFQKCKKCSVSPCVDKMIMVDLRDIYYDMEKHYFAMLDLGDSLFDRLNQNQSREYQINANKQILNNLEYIIGLYKQMQGPFEKMAASEIEAEKIRETIQNLEKEKEKVEEQEEINKSIALIRQESDYINGYARPNYIKYCKSYIDLRKQHANDIRSEGKVIKRQLEHKEL